VVEPEDLMNKQEEVVESDEGGKGRPNEMSKAGLIQDGETLEVTLSTCRHGQCEEMVVG
jgi:hypothetical protein